MAPLEFISSSWIRLMIILVLVLSDSGALTEASATL